METILVTAKKREQALSEVAGSLSVLFADDMARQGIGNLVDIGKTVPNLAVVTFGAGTPASAMPFIRGIGVQDHLILTDSGVSVYLDGVYLGRQIGQNWDLSDIERVELLRGPRGSLWGRNSIGGSINIITRQPDSPASTRLNIETGTRNRRNLSFYHNSRVSNKVALSANLAFKQRDGIGRFAGLPDISDRVGQLRDIAGRFQFSLKPSESFRLRITADGNSGEQGLNPYTTEILPGRSLAGAGLRNTDIAANPYDNNTTERLLTQTQNEAYGVSATATWQPVNTLDMTAVLSQRHSNYSAGLDDDSTRVRFLAFPEEGKADQTSFEWRMNSQRAGADWMVGLFWFEETGNVVQASALFNGQPNALYLTQDASSLGLYGTLGYALTDRLYLEGGVRYTEDDKQAFADINKSAASAFGSRNWTRLSWHLDAAWQVNAQSTLYAALASGYSPGTFPARPYCLFSDPQCFVASGSITAVNYELGLRGEVADRLSGSFALFYTDYSRLPYQTSDTSGDGFDTRNILVDQRTAGIEWEGRLRLTDYLFLHSSLGWMDVDVDGSAVAPLTPELTLSFSPELVWTRTDGSRWRLRLDYFWRDKMFGEPAAGDPRRNSVISGRGLIHFSLGWHSPDSRYEIALYGRNARDKRYTHALINTGDYILRILSNDASEFGLALRIRL